MKTTNWKLLIEEVAKQLGVLETAVISVNSITIDDRGKDGRAQVDVTKGKTPGNLLTTVNQKGTVSVLPGGKLKNELETLPFPTSSPVGAHSAPIAPVSSSASGKGSKGGSIPFSADCPSTQDPFPWPRGEGHWPKGKWLVVDGGCPKTPGSKGEATGPIKYRGCVVKDHVIQDLAFHAPNPHAVWIGTNNAAEFLGICEGLKWYFSNKCTISPCEDPWILYSDSKVAILHVFKKKYESTSKKDNDKAVERLIKEGETYLAPLEHDNTKKDAGWLVEFTVTHEAKTVIVRFFDTYVMGQNPADYKKAETLDQIQKKRGSKKHKK